MTETVVVGSGAPEDGAQTVAESAHEAAVAEGAVQVQAQQAAESAAEAQAAAEVALAAAEANIQSGAAVEGAVASANESAAVASISAEMVHEALQAQTAAINALAAELKAGRQKPSKDNGDGEPPGDRTPAQKEHFINRKVGRRK